MFNTISKAGVGSIVMVVTAFLQIAGFDVDEGTVTEMVNSVVFLAGFALNLYGTWDRDDLMWGLWRK